MFKSTIIRIICVFGIFFAGPLYSQPQLPIGMNLTKINYYTNELLFSDLAKTLGGGTYGYDGFGTGGWLTKDEGSHEWDTGKIADIPMDEQGYPLEIPYNGSYVHALFSNNYPEGTYLVLYDGEGVVHVSDPRSGGTYEIENTPGKIIFYLSGKGLEDQVNGIGEVKFNQLIIKSSTKGNHVRNIRIIPASMEFTYEDNLFYKPFLEAVRPFQTIRLMQTQHTNGQYYVNPDDPADVSALPTDTHTEFAGKIYWEDRRKPDDFTQESTPGKAVCYEYLLQLSNEVRANAWLSIPHRADKHYNYELAKLVKETLDPDLKIYIQYSNEVWNHADEFPQSQWINNNAPGASADIQAALAALPDYPEKMAYMQKYIFDIWLTVFTGEERKRLVLVATSQHAQPVGIQQHPPVAALQQPEFLGVIFKISSLTMAAKQPVPLVRSIASKVQFNRQAPHSIQPG